MEENNIQFYHIESLNNIKKVKTIQIDSNEGKKSFNIASICTLQFIDNLVLLHNFERCDTITYDIKKEDDKDKVIFKNFPMTDLDILIYNKLSPGENSISMLSFNNRMFYERNIFITGSIIVDREKNEFFIVFFNPMTYYENTPVKVNRY
jgi:hypothetical protein